MRLTAIELRRFGRFEDVEIQLPVSAGMHVVHGPNEAGKSTTLDALTYTLYGMPTRGTERDPDYGFRHALPSLRTGVRLTKDDGTELHVVRKRGRANTVVSPTNDVADPRVESLLDGVLRGVPRDVWLAKHALTQERLRAGGRALLASDGDAADALFAAATGITVVRQVLDDVRSRRQALLADSGRAGELHAAIKAHDEARAAVRGARAMGDGYDDKIARRDAINREREQLAGERAARLARAERLEAARAAAGVLDERSRLVAERDSVAPPTISWSRVEHDALREATEALAQASRARDELDTRITLERERLEYIQFDARVIAAEAQITALHESVGGIREGRAKLPELEARVELAQREVDVAASAAPVAPDAIPAPALRDELARLATEGDTLLGADEAAGMGLEDARRALDRERELLDGVGGADDGSLAALAALIETGAAIDVAEHRARIERIAGLRRELERRASMLPGCDAEIVGVRAMELPAQADIDAIAARFAALDERAAEQRTHRTQAVAHLETRGKGLARVEADRAIPDPEALAALRADRDELWRVIRSGVERAASAPQALDEVASTLPAHERASQSSDSYADELANAGQRVGEASALRREIARDELRLATAEAALTEIAAEQQELQRGAWAQLWARSAIAATTPEAMRALVIDIKRIRDDADDLDRIIERHVVEATTVDQLHRELHGALDANWMPKQGAGDIGALVTALDAARARLDEMHATRTERAARQGAVANATRAVESATATAERAAAALTDWNTRWKRSCASVGIAHDTPIKVARAQLLAIDELTSALTEREVRQVAADRMRGSLDRFAGSVGELRDDLAEAAGELDLSSPELATQLLSRMLSDAKVAAARHAEIQTSLELHEANRIELVATADGAERRLAELCAQAGEKAASALIAADAAWVNRETFDQRIREIDQQLASEWRTSAAELLELRSDRDDAQLAAAAASLTEEANATDTQLAALQSERDVLVEQLGLAESSTQVAEAQQRVANALATIERLVPDYRALAIQEHLLAEFLELKSKGDLGPVVRLASIYFERLTCASYTRLQVEPDDQGTPTLTAVRASDATTVSVAGLSEGTRDQLYLALRLATLVSALDEGAEAMPLIVDDILLTFDDERGAATLALLGEIAASTRMQVVFFTHHARLVELAREVVEGDSIAVVELGELTTASA